MESIRLRACALIIQDGAILLIEFKNDDDDGVHYNLPAGGLEPGETFVEAVMREAKEEACIDVEVGSVAFVYEYQPTKNNFIYGNTHSVGITFECKLKAGSIPQLPPTPDSNQTAVKWIPIAELHSIQLYPEINQDILDYYNGKKYRNYVEEQEIQQHKLYSDMLETAKAALADEPPALNSQMLQQTQVAVLFTEHCNIYVAVCRDVFGSNCGFMDLLELLKTKGETRILKMLTMWHNGCIDLSSYHFRKSIYEMNKENLETEIMLLGKERDETDGLVDVYVANPGEKLLKPIVMKLKNTFNGVV
ncbi:hypothetical protein PCCS19_06550 [Paenibacillus sp. CCS19]|uniref:NUDIX domain-containing protein n=1 Tax=Paenibacillus sp. CCS19 TaxID=3158387 RepID=UPI00255F55C6|nr:NUDIX domain-containing protein [Paenibacillus cellulosilyticus]GMK37601.1 hypothetical protein PCCS19_06550 [Paenibacillus cellulosilyticus]